MITQYNPCLPTFLAMPTMENDWLQFHIDPPNATWDLIDRHDDRIALQKAGMRVTYRRGSKRFSALQEWLSPRITESEATPSPHGRLHLLEASCNPDAQGLAIKLSFALSDSHPFLFWKLQLENHGEQPVQIERIELLRLDPAAGGTIFARPPLNPAFFSNGWQSWSYCGVYGAGDQFHRTRLGPLRAPTDVNQGTPQPSRRGHFSSDMFAVLGDRVLRAGILAGFLSQKQHFGSLEARIDSSLPRLRMWANGDGVRLDSGAGMNTDWACLQFIQIDQPDPLGAYLERVAREHGLEDLPPARYPSPTGWCSWYQFSSEQYTGTITASALESNLDALRRLQINLPLQIFQIDDGYQAQVGDWFNFAATFPQGVAPLAEKIASDGLTPGLWLAPFIVHPKSRLAAEHPDWLLRGRLNRPVNAGFLWNTIATALDLTQPDALAYASQVVERAVHEWGFPYIKLDFLYAGALPGKRHDPTVTRAQALRAGIEALRAAAGDAAFLLGCGSPLGSAIGLVNAMRINPDTHWTWYPDINGLQSLVRHEANLPSAYYASRNAISRAPLHRRWWINDPDCLLLRENTSLTEAEVRTTASVVSMTGGSLILSDDLPALSPARLQIAERLLPLAGRAAQILEWFDLETPSRLRLDLENSAGEWHLLAYINWDDEPQDITVNLREFGLDPQVTYLAREFWTQKTHRMGRGKLLRERLLPHDALLLAVRPLTSGQPQYLGSDLHITQGIEVASWKITPRRVAVKLERPGSAQGSVLLSLPKPPKKALLDGQDCHWQTVQEGIYTFSVKFDRAATLLLHR